MNQVAVVIGGGQTLGAFLCHGLAADVLIHLKYEKNREDIGLFGIWRD
ncbi:hypothetical protein MSV56_002493 [Escherichia coli]|nr:hypothetical protein [Escherichia coli]